MKGGRDWLAAMPPAGAIARQSGGGALASWHLLHAPLQAWMISSPRCIRKEAKGPRTL